MQRFHLLNAWLSQPFRLHLCRQIMVHKPTGFCASLVTEIAAKD